MKTAKAVARAVGLDRVYQWFLDNNPSAALPYHNERHSNFMMHKVFEVGMHTGCSDDELELLVLAAMFHDYNHSGGSLTDHENIARAKEGLQACARQLNLDSRLITRACSLIEITEYPYVKEPSNELERILRDCDLLQILDSEDGEDLIFKGLPQEMGLSPYVFREKSPSFYNHVRFNSIWALMNESHLRAQIAAKFA